MEDEEIERLNKDGYDLKEEKISSLSKKDYWLINRGFLLAFISEFCLATSNIFMKKAELFSDIEQAFLRYLLQLFSMYFIIRLNKLEIFSKKASAILVLRGAFGTLSILFTMRSLKLINPSDTIALVNLNVVFVAIFARFFLPDEKLSLIHFFSIPIIFTGNKNLN